MALTKDEFFQTWLAAGESQEQHIVETAWQRYQQTQSPTYTSDPESSDPSASAFKSDFEPFLTHPSISSHIETTKFLTHHANTLPWTPTNLHLQPGQKISTFATGRVWRSRVLDLYIRPQFALWFRVGVDGEIFNSTRDTNTFTVSNSDGGELYIANQFPAWFQTQQGRVVGDLSLHQKAGDGKIELLIIVWKDPNISIPDLLSSYPEAPLLQTELRRPQSEAQTNLPKDWYYFWFLGTSTLYTSPSAKCITCKPAKGIGILQKDLTPTPVFSKGCVLKWDWKIDALPSRLREDTTFSHDYLSVAVEFENGRDITYTWSWELPINYGYWCPLPTWEAREYHVVIRSGTQGLGEWISEERDLYADYEHYIGSKEVPQRIVRVWLISNAAFQRLEGEMTVKGIQLVGGDEKVTEVL